MSILRVYDKEELHSHEHKDDNVRRLSSIRRPVITNSLCGAVLYAQDWHIQLDS